MHTIKHPRLAHALRAASLLYILAWLSLTVFLGLLIKALRVPAKDMLIPVVIATGVTLVLWLSFWIVAARCRCQLCQANPMRSLRCSRNREAKRFLWSYRLRVALSVTFLGRFRCPYCGESFSLKPIPAAAAGLQESNYVDMGLHRPEKLPERRED